MIGETDTEPETGTDPTPVMLALVPLLLAQLSVEDWPEVIEEGLAVKDVIIGAPGGEIVTVTIVLAVALAVELVTVSV